MARKKKVVEEEIKIDPTFTCDEYEISVTAPAGFPDAKEAIIRSKYVPGSFLYLPEIYEGEYSFIKPGEHAKICIALILELDKGNSGALNDTYYVEADKKAEGLKQFAFFKRNLMRVWGGKEPPTEEQLKAQFGLHMRSYHRNILFRFMSYFALGYTVLFTKIEKNPAPVSNPTESLVAS